MDTHAAFDADVACIFARRDCLLAGYGCHAVERSLIAREAVEALFAAVPNTRSRDARSSGSNISRSTAARS